MILTFKVIVAIEPLALSREVLSDASCLEDSESLGGLEDGELASERFGQERIDLFFFFVTCCFFIFFFACLFNCGVS